MPNVMGKSLLPKKLEAFKEEFGDDDMAKLHYEHHQRRRMRNLLKVDDKLNGNG